MGRAGYSSTGILWRFLLKESRERLIDPMVRTRIGAMPALVSDCTPLVESIYAGIEDLAKAKYSRKILVNIVDGAPNRELNGNHGKNSDAVKGVMKRAHRICKALDIDLVGVGLEYDAGWLFENYVNAQGATMYEDVIRSLAKLLAQDGRHAFRKPA